MLPKLRVSPSRKRKRRSHHALKPIQISRCPLTQEPKLSHRACKASGYVRPGLRLKPQESE